MSKEMAFWEGSIKSEAERAGIDTGGMIGMAILHAMVDRIRDLDKQPRLGCATTGELLDEIRARIAINNGLGYRTIDSM